MMINRESISYLLLNQQQHDMDNGILDHVIYLDDRLPVSSKDMPRLNLKTGQTIHDETYADIVGWKKTFTSKGYIEPC